MLGVLTDEYVGVLLRRILAAGAIILRHEVVVEVVIAAYTDGVDTLAQVTRGRVLIPEYADYLRHRVLVVVYLACEVNPSPL